MKKLLGISATATLIATGPSFPEQARACGENLPLSGFCYSEWTDEATGQAQLMIVGWGGAISLYCQDNTTLLIVQFKDHLGSKKWAELKYRVDERQVATAHVLHDSEFAAFRPGLPSISAAKALAAGAGVYMRTWNDEGRQRDLQVDLTGFRPHARKIAQACGWRL